MGGVSRVDIREGQKDLSIEIVQKACAVLSTVHNVTDMYANRYFP